MSKAAVSLGYSQSQVSRLVQEAERESGLKLFRRTGHGVELTESGKYFSVELSQLLADLNAAVRTARQLSTGETGHLRLGYTSISYGMRIRQVLEALRKERPGLTIELVRNRSAELSEAISRQTIHLALVNPPETARGILVHAEWEESLCWVVPKSQESAESIEDILKRVPLVTPPRAQWPALFGRLLTWLDSRQLKVNLFETQIDSFDALMHVAAGSLCTLLPMNIEEIAPTGVRFIESELTLRTALVSREGADALTTGAAEIAVRAISEAKT